MKPDPFIPPCATTPGRVLMTADTIGGVWTYALELARSLGEHGVQVALATMGAALASSQWREAERIPNLEIFESRYRLEWMEDPWGDVAEAGEWLLAVERQLRPDLIHLNNYAHAALPWSAPKLIVAHSCVLSWWRAVKGTEAPWAWARYREVVTTGVRAADAVVAPSRAMLRELQHHYGPLRRGDVIPNGRELPFGHAPKEPFILSGGRLWDEAKNIAALASIAPELSWPVSVAGERTEPNGMPVSFPNVHLLGHIPLDEMARWLERASIYCLPARYEPFGLSILEAALAGCALVLGDIPSLRETWEGAALFVPPDRPAALRETLRSLIHNDSLRRDLAARGRARALEFTTPRMAAAYLALYSELTRKVAPTNELLICES